MAMVPPGDSGRADDPGPETGGPAGLPGEADRQPHGDRDGREPEPADDLVEEPDWCEPGPEEPEDWDRATLEEPLGEEDQGDWWEADEEGADFSAQAAAPEDLGEDDRGLDLGPPEDLDEP